MKGHFLHIIAAILSIAIPLSVVKALKSPHFIPASTYAQQFVSDNFYTIEILLVVFLAFTLNFFIYSLSYLNKGRIAKSVGLFFFKPKASIKESVKFLKNKIVDYQNINIVSATGWQTFGDTESPLYHAVTNNDCRSLKVMLLCPLCEQAKNRAKKIGIENFEEYRDEIYRTVSFLKERNNIGNNIELKLYDTPPRWKLILLPSFVWVQQYPETIHVQESPCYVLENWQKNNSSKIVKLIRKIRKTAIDRISIYDQLYNQFNWMWSNKNVYKYDFKLGKLILSDSSPWDILEERRQGERRGNVDRRTQYPLTNRRRGIVNNQYSDRREEERRSSLTQGNVIKFYDRRIIGERRKYFTAA